MCISLSFNFARSPGIEGNAERKQAREFHSKRAAAAWRALRAQLGDLFSYEARQRQGERESPMSCRARSQAGRSTQPRCARETSVETVLAFEFTTALLVLFIHKRRLRRGIPEKLPWGLL